MRGGDRVRDFRPGHSDHFDQDLRRTRFQSKMRRLSKSQETYIEEQIELILQQMRLSHSSHVCNLTGNRELAENSLRQYSFLFSSFKLFLKRIGDFHSLLILDEKAPLEFCPSLSADSLIAYIDYKVLPEGDPLFVKPESASCSTRIGPVVDIFTKRQISACGTWKSPGACNQFLSAISTLHSSRKQNGQYQEPCQECIIQYEARATGCRFHPDFARLWRTGCPRTLEILKNRYTKVTKTDIPDYIPQGDSPLLPHELIDVRNALLSRNDKSSMRLWVMILFHIQLFLRSAEGCFFQFSDFVYGLTSVDSETNHVSAIGVRIKGKTDESSKLFMIWRNDKVPELCLVRHLLAWVHFLGTDSGYLFPDKSGDSGLDYNTFNNQ